MKIKANVEIDVPKSFYCNKPAGRMCYRVERSRHTAKGHENEPGKPYCGLFGDWLVEDEGKIVKCRDCVRAVLKELEKR